MMYTAGGNCRAAIASSRGHDAVRTAWHCRAQKLPHYACSGEALNLQSLRNMHISRDTCTVCGHIHAQSTLWSATTLRGGAIVTWGAHKLAENYVLPAHITPKKLLKNTRPAARVITLVQRLPRETCHTRCVHVALWQPLYRSDAVLTWSTVSRNTLRRAYMKERPQYCVSRSDLQQ